METEIISKTIQNSEYLKKWAGQFTHRRHIYEKLSKLSKEYFPGIAGMRGIGKTVLLLQLAGEAKNSIYFSADYTYLKPYSIYEIVNSLRKQGFENIFIDEIHTATDWQAHLKTIYDEHEARIFFSGSSAMKIKESGADLSRRAVILELAPISFREYLLFRKGIQLHPYSLKEVMEKKKEIALKYPKSADFIAEYMQFGGVLYSGEGFQEALQNSLEKVITKDLTCLRDMNIAYENDIYRILYHIAHSSPYEFSYSSVSQKLGISKSFLIKLLSDLVKVGLIKIVLPCMGKGVNVKKEPKVYLSVPYRYFFNAAPNTGALREEFFANHIQKFCYFKTERGEKTADFLVDGKIIEVGGAAKTAIQNPDVIAMDALRFDGKYIPLFLFGLLY